MRIPLVLAPLVVVFVGVLPAFAAAPAAELLLNQPPPGFQPVPAQAEISGPTDVQQLGAIDGLDVPANVDSADGYLRAWTRDESALVGYALTFADAAAAATVLDDLVASLQAGDDAAALPDVDGGAVSTMTESAAYTKLETAVFARGSAVFVFVGSGVARGDVVDAVLRQEAALSLPTAPAAAPLDGLPVEPVPGTAVAAGLMAVFLAARRIRHTRRQPAPAGGWSLTPPR